LPPPFQPPQVLAAPPVVTVHLATPSLPSLQLFTPPVPILFPTVLPTPTPPVQPIPPGGATAPSTAPRREKARKHASQSAYTVRPAGAGADWFYPVLGVTTVGVLLLAAFGLTRPAPRAAAALARSRRS
jgi:hypothetical protein